MTLATAAELFSVLDATWPTASENMSGEWLIRDGEDGGKRVSAARWCDTGDMPDLESGPQPGLVMVHDHDIALDQHLAAAGYDLVDPVTMFACPIAALTDIQPERLSGFDIWPALAITNELWENSGIGIGRRQVMQRANSPKTSILARAEGRAAGAAFVAIHQRIAMIHAIEVWPPVRRTGVGINIMRVAAHWAQDNGARQFSLVVTDANLAAIALYKKLGMSEVGHYHYRMRQQD